jgi:hypothetical protein
MQLSTTIKILLHRSNEVGFSSKCETLSFIEPLWSPQLEPRQDNLQAVEASGLLFQGWLGLILQQ